MIHHGQLEHIRAERAREEFIRPWYGQRSIAELVPTVAAIFDADIRPGRPIFPRELWAEALGAKKVVVLLVDGLAWHHLVRYAEDVPLLSRFAASGEVFPITSVFPSTTPAALTTLHSGLTPQEHGLPEWTVFFEELDVTIETLPFRILATGGRDTLLELGGHADMLYEGRTIYEDLRTKGIPSYVFGYFEYATGAYSRATHEGAFPVSYINADDFASKLRELLTAVAGPAYFFLYWGSVDSVMHKFGPYTQEHLAELRFFSAALERELFEKLTPEAARDTVVLLTADHGQVNVARERIVYLNQYPLLEANYRRSRRGAMIPPTGGPHDVFLFVRPEKVTESIELLERELGDRAWVMRASEAVALGLFGMGAPTARFSRRIGNILVLPRAGHHIWYEHLPGSLFRQLGTHGGLSEEEMVVPLASARLERMLSPRR